MYWVAQVCNADSRDHRRVAKNGWRAGVQGIARCPPGSSAQRLADNLRAPLYLRNAAREPVKSRTTVNDFNTSIPMFPAK